MDSSRYYTPAAVEAVIASLYVMHLGIVPAPKIPNQVNGFTI
jgi:hypothetical protein